MKPIYDIILREYNNRWMPIIRVDVSGTDWVEMYRGEYQETPEEALARGLHNLTAIKQNEEK